METPQPRNRAGAWLMAAPLIFVGLIASAFGGLVLMVRTSGSADGERIRATVKTACAETSMAVLSHRASAMGLGDAELSITPRGLSLTATLPETETDIQTIPAVLAQTGLIRMLDSEGIELATNDEVEGAGVEIDNAGMPTTLVQFDDVAKHALRVAIKNGPIQVELDGTLLGEHRGLPDLDDGYLELASGDGKTAIRMRRAADRSILLSSGPLPCPARLLEVVLAPGPG
jgi:hypothetical protein